MAAFFLTTKLKIMLPEVRNALSEALLKKMSETGYNWHSIQGVKLREVWNGCPAEHTTLYKLYKYDNYTMHKNKVKKLLEFFNIGYVENYGIISLK